MKISIYPPLSIQEIGQRPNQEDCIDQWDNRLFVLCDGMGGHEKGEVASQTVCQSLVKWFDENIKDGSFSDDQLREAIEYAYQQLDQYADGNLKQMGTTLTLLYIYKQGVTAAHIGDSRIYHIRPGVGTLYQSRDHSLAFDLFQAGEISYEEMQNFAQKNVITRAMTPGLENRHRADIIHITDIQLGDFFYMCSDGMLEQMSNDELLALLSFDTTDEEKQKQLIEATSNNQDNHSAWLIHVKNVVKEERDETLENEESTSRCNAINIIHKTVITKEDNDVVIVSQPTIQHREKNKWISFLVLVLTITVALAIACVFFFFHEEKPKFQRPKPMIHHRIKTNPTEDTTQKASSRIIQHEPARNQ